MHKQNTGIISLIPNVKSRKVYMKFERFDLHYPSCFMALRLTTVNCVHVGATQVMVRSLDDFTLTRYPLYCHEHLFTIKQLSSFEASLEFHRLLTRLFHVFTYFSAVFHKSWQLPTQKNLCGNFIKTNFS